MKRLTLAAACALVVTGAAVPATADAGHAVAVTRTSGERVPDSYIVTVRDGADARGVAAAAGVSPRYVYAAALNGFAATMNAGQLNAVSRHRDVVAIEEDAVASATATQYMDSNGDPWGLDRIDQRSRPLSRSYTYNATASSVRAYVIDSGIYTSHPDFGGRAMAVYDAFGGNGQDCNGHGTHVAGTVGGATWGVAKAVLLRGVRVLDCNGNGSYSGIISAVDWVRSNHIKPAVANMSLGGPYSGSLNTAVTNLANAGVFVAVAAGNEGQNACNVSPASASNVTVLAASDKNDARAWFSNYGSCVDLYAPGVSIKSAWPTSTSTWSDGTSMASPHAAGVAALYKARYGDVSSSTINSWLINNATTGVISGNPTGTPNRLLYKSTL